MKKKLNSFLKRLHSFYCIVPASQPFVKLPFIRIQVISIYISATISKTNQTKLPAAFYKVSFYQTKLPEMDNVIFVEVGQATIVAKACQFVRIQKVHLPNMLSIYNPCSG